MSDLTLKDKPLIQCCGSYDGSTDEYCFTAASGGLYVTFEFLNKEDIKEMQSCLACLLLSESTEE